MNTRLRPSHRFGLPTRPSCVRAPPAVPCSRPPGKPSYGSRRRRKGWSRLGIFLLLFSKQFAVGVLGTKGWPHWLAPLLNCVQAVCPGSVSGSCPLLVLLSPSRAGQPRVLLLSFIFLSSVVLMSSCCRALYAALRGREQQVLPTNLSGVHAGIILRSCQQMNNSGGLT